MFTSRPTRLQRAELLPAESRLAGSTARAAACAQPVPAPGSVWRAGSGLGGARARRGAGWHPAGRSRGPGPPAGSRVLAPTWRPRAGAPLGSSVKMPAGEPDCPLKKRAQKAGLAECKWPGGVSGGGEGEGASLCSAPGTQPLGSLAQLALGKVDPAERGPSRPQGGRHLWLHAAAQPGSPAGAGAQPEGRGHSARGGVSPASEVSGFAVLNPGKHISIR